MGIFPPPNSCFLPGATRFWLVAVMVGLFLIGIALLVQVGMLWHRMAQVHVAWWQRLPLVLPLVWAGVCAFEAVQAFIYYRFVWELPRCPPRERCIYHGLCPPPTPLGGEAQVAIIVAVCLLVLGWLALSALARRIRAA